MTAELVGNQAAPPAAPGPPSDQGPGTLHRVGEAVWTSSPLIRTRRGLLRARSKALTSAYSLYKVHPTTWRDRDQLPAVDG